MTQEELNSVTNGIQKNQERLSNEAQQDKDRNLEQQKLELQQQQLNLQQQQQNTNQQLVIGGLILGGILVLSIAVYLLVKTFKTNKKS
ncbi:MAG TPA: hypothetical protein VLA77_01320 [Candidatus Saccharimonadales bacterium]|nr:hypothetical protein [Candidatus Saccharimonadales bacterium]